MTLSNLSRSNRFILPFALFGLAMLAACGNGNGSVGSPNQNGFTNTTLSGTYVISMAGEDVNLGASTGVLFRGGGNDDDRREGNITGGTVDINDPDLGGTGVFTGQALSASTYSVSQDGRGTGRAGNAGGHAHHRFCADDEQPRADYALRYGRQRKRHDRSPVDRDAG